MSGVPVVYRCSLAARWLPRTLAAAILAAAMLAAFRIDPRVDSIGWGPVRSFVILAGAVVALVVLRQGAEVRTTVRLDDDGLSFRHGRREARLPVGEIESLAYAPPFSASRRWLPATVLIDRGGGAWRLSALLRDGERLIDGLAASARRSDLDSWIDVLRLHQRMRRSSWLCAVGYLVAAAVLGAGVLFYVTGPTP